MSWLRHTDIVTVVKIWAYSFGVTIVLALVYFVLSKITVRGWLYIRFIC